MKCMCAQTRPRFILSSEGVLGGMEFEPMLTPREKSPLPENVPRGGSNPRHRGQRAQALPTELFRPQTGLQIEPLCPDDLQKTWTSVHTTATAMPDTTLTAFPILKAHAGQRVGGTGNQRVEFCWLVACLMSQQHASVSQGLTCSHNSTCVLLRGDRVADQSISPSHRILTPGRPVPVLTP